MKSKLSSVLGLVLAAVLVAGAVPSALAAGPAAPELDVPKDKAKNQVATTVLKWKPVEGIKSYRVMLALSADTLAKAPAKAPCTECLVDKTVDAPTYQIPMKVLKKDAPYFWTVRSVGDEEGPNAVVRSYTLASTFFQDMD
jgi:hypothetical protein